MKYLTAVAAIVAALTVAFGTRAQEPLAIHVSPEGPIPLNVTSRRNRHADLALHTVGIVNHGPGTVEITAARLTLLQEGQPLLTKQIAPERLVRDTRQIAGAPMPIFAAMQLLNTDGVTGFLKGAAPAQTATLDAGEALMTAKHHFSIDGMPDTLRVEIDYRSADGVAQTASKAVPVAPHRSSIRYRMPVEGSWFMRALPGIESHHRLNASTEFAVDFFKLTPDGRTHAGDRFDTSGYPGYGAPVLAAASGVVVHVESQAVQDREAYRRRDGETGQQYGQRLQGRMMAAISESPRRALGGNLVTLRHEAADGTVEYSSYGHLMAGSVAVAVGDRVEAGELIGRVGDTGDSPAVHLHFQVNAGPDAFMSKSLPVAFDDMAHAVEPAEPGLVVRSRDVSATEATGGNSP